MGIQRDILINSLKKVVRNNYILEDGDNVMQYIPLMLQNIGDVDSYLRDELIYSTFYHWIIELKYIYNDNLIMILELLIDEKYLFYELGENGLDSVFKRSFSALLIAVILIRNITENFLSKDMLTKVMNSIVIYFNKEKDFRGFDIRKGWIHSAAHGADVLWALIQCDFCNKTSIMQVLDSIKNVINNGEYILHNEEDERIARVIYLIVVKEMVVNEEIIHWIDQLIIELKHKHERTQYISRVNTKNMIRCLYFSLLIHYGDNNMLDYLVLTEKKLNRFISK